MEFVLDNHVDVGFSLGMYRDGYGGEEGIVEFYKLSLLGWIVTIGCTYSGYTFMVIGINYFHKFLLRKKIQV